MPRDRAVWYEPDHVSFGAFMMSPQVVAPLMEVCGAIAEVAKSTTPYDKTNTTGDHLRDGYKVKPGEVWVVGGNPRPTGIVYNEHRHAAPNEFGSATNPRHRMLARAAARFGDFHDPSGIGM